MAVLTTEKIHVGGLMENKSEIIRYLQQHSVVELKEASSGSEVFLVKDYSPEVQALEEDLRTVEEALSITKGYSSEKSSLFDSLKGKEIRPMDEYVAFKENYRTALETAKKIIAAQNEVYELESESIRLKASLTQYEPWLSLTLPLNYSGTTHTSAFIGSIPSKKTQGEIERDIKEIDPELEEFAIDVFSDTKTHTYFIALTLKEHRNRLKDALDQLKFTLPQISANRPAKEIYNEIKEQIASTKETEQNTTKALEELAVCEKDLKFMNDYILAQIDEKKASGYVGESKYSFLMEGYVLKENAEPLKQKLMERFDCVVDISEPEENENAPLTLKNNRFSEPLEDVVAGFSYPSASEIDPTAVTSVFYYIMFGLMFSDAGYGFILALVTGILVKKYKNMPSGINRFMRLFFWCGVATTFWGVVFSSYFGNVVDVVSENFFGKMVSIPPLWFNTMENPMKLLIFCLGLGILHLTTGYIMVAANAVKNKDYPAVIYDTVFPIAFLVGLLAVLMSSKMFDDMAGFSFTLTPKTQQMWLGLSGLSAVGIVLTGGRESRSPIKRLLKGIFALYNTMSGWLSDVLSYSRLLALGLATGVIATVVNTLAAMPGDGVIGAVAFILIFVLGHTMNFAINILGSYVHSNRLEYVEFFGKFFTGGGRKFAPLSLNTKYYNFKEDINNG